MEEFICIGGNGLSLDKSLRKVSQLLFTILILATLILAEYVEKGFLTVVMSNSDQHLDINC